MAAQVEISTVKAKKEFEDLIEQTKNLVGQLKVLESRARLINKTMGVTGQRLQLIAKSNRAAATAVTTTTIVPTPKLLKSAAGMINIPLSAIATANPENSTVRLAVAPALVQRQDRNLRLFLPG